MITDNLTLNTFSDSIIESFVDIVIYPKIIKFVRRCGVGYKDLLIPLSECFEKYFRGMYWKCSWINEFADGNRSFSLKDVYIPQTLVKKEDKKKVVIDGFPVDIIKQNKKILISDTAGMGKSTIIKRMFIDLIDNCTRDVGIPVFIELRKLNRERSILNEIHGELCSLSKEFDKELLLKLFQTGGFVFFLDGYDEISIAEKKSVTIDLREFISQTESDNYFILTSRPEEGLYSYEDFQSFSIQPLTKNEAYQLWNNYALKEKKVLYKYLEELHKSRKYDSIDEYLGSPLLVSLFYTAYKNRATIPFNKPGLYRLVFETIFEKHDSSKNGFFRDKRSKLNMDDFARVLRFVGYQCLTRIGVNFNEKTILETIVDARRICGNLQFEESDYLEDLYTTVPVFCKEGRSYRWVYESLMYYFAALFIYYDMGEKKDMVLNAICNSNDLDFNSYLSMLDLYYDIDRSGFDRNFILPLCEKYLSFYNENDFNSNTTNHDYIEERIGLLFYFNDIYLVVRSAFGERTINEKMTNAKEVPQEQFGENKSYRPVYYPEKNNALYCMLENPLTEHNRDIMSIVWHILKVKGTIAPFVEYQPQKTSITGLEFNNAIQIDVHTKEDDEKLYKALNDVLQLFMSIPVLFDYEACKNEVNRIKAELSRVRAI